MLNRQKFNFTFILSDALLSVDGTTDVSVFDPPNQIVALACSFLIGFGDAAANTQVTSILGGVIFVTTVEIGHYDNKN